MLFRLPILVIQSKKLTITGKKKNSDHGRSNITININITIQEFNKLTPETFATRLTQANLTSKTDIATLIKNTDFDNK